MSAALLVAALLPGADPTPVPIVNGSMTAGTAVPDGWADKWEGSGTLTVKRDTATFKVGPASLSLTPSGPDAKTLVQQVFDAKPGTPVGVGGYLKAAGRVAATVGVQAYGDNYKGLSFQPVGKIGPDADWTPFAGTVTLPPGTVKAAVAVQVSGAGTVWVDEVTADPKAVAALAAEAQVAARDRPPGPPKAPNGWTAGEGYFADFPLAWRLMHDDYVKRAKQGGADIVFLGDSITQAWGIDGKDVWAAKFAPRKAVNFGIGGDTTAQVIWRVEHGTLDGLTPKVVVLMIGTNNRWGKTPPAADIAKGVRACVAAVHAKAPAAKILLLDVFPTGWAPDDAGRKLLADVNKHIADDPLPAAVTRLDLGPKFINPDGKITPDMMPDSLHLSAKAYAVWADAMEPVLAKLLRTADSKQPDGGK